MVGRLVVHPGLMKTGTSSVQRRLESAPEELARVGVLFPRPWARQVVAARGLLGRGDDEAWRAIVARLGEHDGDGVLSMEQLAVAGPEVLDRIVADLTAIGADLRCVVTVRDIGRAVPAMWQEVLKNGSSIGWGDYVDGVHDALRTGPDAPSQVGVVRGFWRQQGAATVVGQWVERLGADRVRVVTVPPPGSSPELLWERFCEASGLPLDDVPAAPVANESLSAEAAEVLVRLNRALRAGSIPSALYERTVKRTIAKGPLAAASGARIGYVPAPEMREYAAQQAEALRAGGAGVVGDLADLDPVEVAGADPDALDEALVSAVAVDLAAAVVRERVEAAAERPRATSPRRAAAEPRPASGDRGWAGRLRDAVRRRP